MSPLFKQLLIAALILSPVLTFAADPSAVAEPKPAPSIQPALILPLPASTQPPAIASVQSTRVGYVDMARIGNESEKGKALKNLLNTRKEQLQTKVDAKKKQLEKQKSSIEAKIASMTPPQREAKAKEFQKKVEDFQKFGQKSEEELMALQEKETRALFEAIEQAASRYGTANGYAVIVIKKELLHIGKGVDAADVTDSLIKDLDADGKK